MACFRRKQGWTLKFVHYMKSKKKEDVQGLVTGSTLSIDDANFKQFMDVSIRQLADYTT